MSTIFLKIFRASLLLSLLAGEGQPQPLLNLIAHAAEDGQPRCLTSFGFCRINKAPVDAFRITREDWALLVRLVTDRDYVVEFFANELVH